MYLKYFKWLIKHKWYVFIECCKLGIPIRGILHDLSKFFPSEFFAYAQYFYGDNEDWLMKEIAESDLNYAWLHHQKRNKHHWQYWVLQEDSGREIILDMPDKYRKEMLADWRGAGRAINGIDETKHWYLKNRGVIKIHPDTRRWVKEQLMIKKNINKKGR